MTVLHNLVRLYYYTKTNNVPSNNNIINVFINIFLQLSIVIYLFKLVNNGYFKYKTSH